MINVSNDFKTRTKKIKQQNIKLGIVEGELTVKEVHFMPVKQFNALPVWMLRSRKKVIAKELKYSFEGNLFKTIMKQIEITVKNAGELKDKNVNFQYGIYTNNDFEYIDLGDYYIKDVEDDKGKTELVVTGYDKMIHFMKTFKQSELQLTYPCTMLVLIQKMCEVCGVGLYSTNFFNADLQVDEDYFTAQELTYRDVLEKIAESTETTIFIKDNKLYLHKLADSPVEKLDASYLTGLTVKEKFGPINALVLGRGDVEDNVEAKDDTSISKNGRFEIRFDENEFIEYQRKTVIDRMFEQIKGLEYYAFEGSDIGAMWLEPGDLIEVEDTEQSKYKTIYLKANIIINTGISSDIGADIPIETNTEYKVTTKEEKKTLKVQRLAKKNEGLIQDLIQETTEQGQKLTEVKQTVDGIKETVSSVETKVEEVKGKAESAQSTANTANSNAIQAQNTANEAKETAKINTTKITEVEKTVDGISQSVTSVEEKIETVESKADTAQLIANSATQKAENAETNANNAQSTANIANNNAQKAQDTANNINNNLSQNYYTKTETNSQIKQEADSITQSVSKTYSTKTETTNAKDEAIKSANASTDKKLEGYITTAQMKSEIKQTADEINLEVKKKVDENEIISSINQSAEAIQIKADKINIHGKKVSFETNIESKYRYSSSDLNNIQKYIMGEISLTDSQLELYDINKDGKLTSSDYVIIRNLVDSNGDVTIKGSFEINPDSASRSLILRDAKRNIITSIGLLGMETESFYCQNFESDKGVIKALEVQENLIVNREGHVMHGRNLEHTYSCLWTGSQLQFWVDNTNVGTLSDKRLKKEIQEIDNDFIKAIEEIEMKQFKIANRNGLISFGILAQDLIEIFKKYKKNPFDYEVVQETQYRTDDDTIYYTINYEQFLILKQKATDIKIKQLQEENKNKDELIKELIKRVEKLEGRTNGN